LAFFQKLQKPKEFKKGQKLQIWPQKNKLATLLWIIIRYNIIEADVRSQTMLFVASLNM